MTIQDLIFPVEGVSSDLDNSLTQSFDGEEPGAVLPDTLEVLDHLDKIEMYWNIGTNQAGSLYKKFEKEVFRVKPEWSDKHYPTTEESIERLANALKNLRHPNLTVLISTYDPYLVRILTQPKEEPDTDDAWLAAQMTGGITELDIARAAEEIARITTISLRQLGFINVHASAAKDWRKPDIGMFTMTEMIIKEQKQREIPRSRLLYIGDRHEGVTKAAVDQWAAQKAGWQFLPAENKRKLLSLKKAE